MTNLNILVIHGMGSRRKFYSHPMRDEIRGRVGDQWADRVRWEEVYLTDNDLTNPVATFIKSILGA